jgi:predicted nucleic acid-binding protein
VSIRDFLCKALIVLPSSVDSIPMLRPGETSAISLAIDLHADLLLIDEIPGRKAAVARRIHVTGTIGIVERAAEQGP